ncbi:hypothetical protein MBLNU457_5394t2 [Dothideomycetes sp. NU457]
MAPWIFNGTPQLDSLSDYPAVLGVAWSFTPLLILVVATRFWLRRKKLAYDDWIIFFGMLCSIAYAVLATLQTRFGLGLNPKLRPKVDVPWYMVYNYSSRPIHQSGITAFKVALCVSYLRMTDRTSRRWYRRIVIASAIISILAAIVFSLLNLLQCKPVKKAYIPTLPGECLAYAPYNFAVSATNIILDLLIFGLPIPLFVKMSINMKTKLQLSLMFALGLLVTVCSITKATYILPIQQGHDSSPFVILSQLEIDTIVASLPTLRPLVASGIRVITKAGSSNNRRQSHPYELNEFSGGNSSNGRRTNGSTQDRSGRKPNQMADVISRSDSEEKILGLSGLSDHEPRYRHDSADDGDHGIRKTTMYEVHSTRDDF